MTGTTTVAGLTVHDLDRQVGHLGDDRAAGRSGDDLAVAGDQQGRRLDHRDVLDPRRRRASPAGRHVVEVEVELGVDPRAVLGVGPLRLPLAKITIAVGADLDDLENGRPGPIASRSGPGPPLRP